MAVKANLIIDQGSDFSKTLTVTDDNGANTDLTGFTGEGQIRKHYTSSTYTPITVSFGTPRSEGQLTLSLGRTLTANLEAGRYVYDVELTSSANTTTRLLEGVVTVTPEVTR